MLVTACDVIHSCRLSISELKCLLNGTPKRRLDRRGDVFSSCRHVQARRADALPPRAVARRWSMEVSHCVNYRRVARSVEKSHQPQITSIQQLEETDTMKTNKINETT